MSSKRTIKASEILKDIKGGLSDAELKAKYALSSKSLHAILTKLVASKAVDGSELTRRGLLNAPVTDVNELREGTKGYSLFSIPVYDSSDLQQEGWLTDVSEQGLQVAGIDATAGERRGLLIRADEFADVYPFAFDVVCRWVRADEPGGEVTAGFEITGISEMGRQQLQALIRLLTIGA